MQIGITAFPEFSDLLTENCFHELFMTYPRLYLDFAMALLWSKNRLKVLLFTAIL